MRDLNNEYLKDSIVECVDDAIIAHTNAVSHLSRSLQCTVSVS